MKTLGQSAARACVLLIVLLFGLPLAHARDVVSPDDVPRIDGVDVVQVDQLRPGSQLLFTVFGSPGGRAAVNIEGAAQRLDLVEHEAGVYEGIYAVGERDRIVADSRVVADLRVHQRLASAVLEEPLVLGTPMPSADAAGDVVPTQAPRDERPLQSPRRLASRIDSWPTSSAVQPPTPACAQCGVIEEVRVSPVPGSPSGLGALVGALVGAFIGDQVGHGESRRGTRILGAVGGAVAGHEIERRSGMRNRYDIVVRLRSGERRAVAYDQMPALQVGDSVRVADGRVLRLP